LKDKKLILDSLLNILGVSFYIFLVAQIMENGERWFGKLSNNILGPVAFLMLFTLSAAVVGGLIIGKPLYLFFNGQKKESARMVVYSIEWLFIITTVVFLILATL